MTVPDIYIPQPGEETIPGANVVLLGPSGTGKTYSIGTAVDAGYEVFFLGLEPGVEALLTYWTSRNLPIPQNLHWHCIRAQENSFADMADAAKRINTMSLEILSKAPDTNRGKFTQMESIYTALHDFKCQRTGESFGSPAQWGTNRILVLDGLTNLSRAAMACVVGGKSVRSIADWGIAADLVEKTLRKLCDDCYCHFVLLAHTEREMDPVLGGSKLMVATLGRALPPKIPAMFSDVVFTVREEAKWYWDTINSQVDMKTRNLPMQAKLAPDFRAIFRQWSKNNLAAFPPKPVSDAESPLSAGATPS